MGYLYITIKVLLCIEYLKIFEHSMVKLMSSVNTLKKARR